MEKQTLVHYKACSTKNFVTLKRLSAGRTVGLEFRYEEKPLVDYIRDTNKSIDDASEGAPISPVALFETPLKEISISWMTAHTTPLFLDTRRRDPQVAVSGLSSKDNSAVGRINSATPSPASMVTGVM